MSFSADFLPLMGATVTVTNPASRDAYGKTTYATAVSVPAKVTYVNRIARTVTGESITVTAEVHLPPPGYRAPGYTTAAPTVGVEGRMVLPDGLTRTVVSVDLPFDEDGTAHHQKVSLTG